MFILEHYFTIYSASTVAASSIAASLVGLKWDIRTNTKVRHLLDLLTDLTGIEQVKYFLFHCINKYFRCIVNLIRARVNITMSHDLP